jgi:hypothetical protein
VADFDLSGAPEIRSVLRFEPIYSSGSRPTRRSALAQAASTPRAVLSHVNRAGHGPQTDGNPLHPIGRTIPGSSPCAKMRCSETRPWAPVHLNPAASGPLCPRSTGLSCIKRFGTSLTLAGKFQTALIRWGTRKCRGAACE